MYRSSACGVIRICRYRQAKCRRTIIVDTKQLQRAHCGHPPKQRWRMPCRFALKTPIQLQEIPAGASAAFRGCAEQNPFSRRQVRSLTCRDPAFTLSQSACKRCRPAVLRVYLYRHLCQKRFLPIVGAQKNPTAKCKINV